MEGKKMGLNFLKFPLSSGISILLDDNSLIVDDLFINLSLQIFFQKEI